MFVTSLQVALATSTHLICGTKLNVVEILSFLKSARRNVIFVKLSNEEMYPILTELLFGLVTRELLTRVCNNC